MELTCSLVYFRGLIGGADHERTVNVTRLTAQFIMGSLLSRVQIYLQMHQLLPRYFQKQHLLRQPALISCLLCCASASPPTTGCNFNPHVWTKMAASKKAQEDKNLKVLRELAALPANRQCMDCHQRGPTYVNTTIWSFVCTACSGRLWVTASTPVCYNFGAVFRVTYVTMLRQGILCPTNQVE